VGRLDSGAVSLVSLVDDRKLAQDRRFGRTPELRPRRQVARRGRFRRQPISVVDLQNNEVVETLLLGELAWRAFLQRITATSSSRNIGDLTVSIASTETLGKARLQGAVDMTGAGSKPHGKPGQGGNSTRFEQQLE
jgi:hypothetical protein